jgi:hypothetical protein
MNLLRFVPIIIRWAPIVYSAVITIEEILGPGTEGKEKKRIALAWLSEMAEQFTLPWGEAAIAVLSDLIDTTVGILHLTGHFSRMDEFDAEDRDVALADSEESEIFARVNVDKIAQKDPVLAEFLEYNLPE